MLSRIRLIKSVTYRVYSSFITFVVSFVLTQNLVASVSIGVLDSLVKILSYYVFESIWNSVVGIKAKPAVIWLTGLSGAGKTTIAHALIQQFKNKSITPVLLDGDEIRHAIKQNGFDEESRKKHNLNVGFIASLFEKQGNVVIVSLISPYDDIRNEIRLMCSNFIEVYVATNLEVCMQRDPKGLYKKAKAGEIKDFTGISAPYYPPLKPEITIDTFNVTVPQAVGRILQLYKRQP